MIFPKCIDFSGFKEHFLQYLVQVLRSFYHFLFVLTTFESILDSFRDFGEIQKS